MRKTLPKTATRRGSIKFTNCNWPRCGCKRDPDDAPYFHKRRREGRRLIEEGCVSWKDLVATCNALGREPVEEPKSDETLPKTAVGSLHLEFKTCGRPNCRCRRGLLHGPYLYRHSRDGGRQRKEYVPMKRLGEVLLEMERQQATAKRPAEVVRVLKELKNA